MKLDGALLAGSSLLLSSLKADSSKSLDPSLSRVSLEHYSMLVQVLFSAAS